VGPEKRDFMPTFQDGSLLPREERRKKKTFCRCWGGGGVGGGGGGVGGGGGGGGGVVVGFFGFGGWGCGGGGGWGGTGKSVRAEKGNYYLTWVVKYESCLYEEGIRWNKKVKHGENKNLGPLSGTKARDTHDY